MSEELRWVLIIFGALIIGGVLLHGLWSIRKNEKTDTPAPAATPKAAVTEPAAEQIDIQVDRDEPQIGNIEISTEDDDVVVDEAQSDDDVLHNDYIILHIQAPEGLPIQGASLLPLLLTLGFKYSEEGFFNRHEDASGQGPVLFRLVNMYNPGTFDVDNMEQFQTGGVSLFMTLPCEGEALASFNMLHNAAKKLADEFGAQILDHNRLPLDVATTRQYVEKVREYA
jgi:cell division protein ZipA